MPVHHSRRAIRAALVLAVPAIALAARPGDAPTTPRPFTPGIVYTFRMTSTMPNGKPTSGKGQVAGSQARLDFDPGSQAGLQMLGGTSGYIIVKNDGSMTIVDPDKKQYFTLGSDAMGGMMTAVSGMIKMEIKDLKTDIEKVGPGGTMLGYPTTKWHMTQSYSMKMSVMGRGSETASSTSSEIYVATGLADLLNPFTNMSKTMGRMLGNANAFAELSKQSADAFKKVNGVPLKTVMDITSTDDKGTARTSNMTYEITSISKADIPNSVFEMPAGYTSVDLPTAQPAVGADGAMPGKMGTDSSKSMTDAAKDAAKEKAKQDAAEAAKKKLKGLFGRP
ncbi:MAG: DUF4412 domain-containing protein [Gemmatimonadota bacterium]|nr:DUF4412 domain-containing protein [Gemmatimonadota bacterium]